MSRSRQPNIILFFTDQQRWDTVGAYGANPLGLTPYLDRLSSRGTLYTRAFTPQPVCGPARGCIQTGQYATRHGVWRNHIPLEPDTPTIGHWMRDAGYTTGYIGKWHLGPGPNRADKERVVPAEYRTGYDFWLASDILEFTSRPYHTRMYDNDNQPVDLPGYRVDALTSQAIEYIEERCETSENKPFFLTVSYIEPHHQNDLEKFTAPNGYAGRYGGFDHVPWDLVGKEGDWKKELPDYYGMVARLDETLGRLTEALDRLQLSDDTVVLFFSDHGCHFRTRNSEYKRSPHESSIRVPLAAWGPGFDGGGVRTELTSLLDIPRTILDLAGVEPLVEMDGSSLLGLADERREQWRDDIFVQISEAMVGRAVRTDRWKYAVHAPELDGWRDSSSERYEDYCLYDLHTDPWEQRNLIGDNGYDDVRSEMRSRLVRNMNTAGEGSVVIR
jgi:arylsulfatase A-like enzyme